MADAPGGLSGRDLRSLVERAEQMAVSRALRAGTLRYVRIAASAVMAALPR